MIYVDVSLYLREVNAIPDELPRSRRWITYSKDNVELRKVRQ